MLSNGNNWISKTGLQVVKWARSLLVNLREIFAHLFSVVHSVFFYFVKTTPWIVKVFPCAFVQVKNSFNQVDAHRLRDKDISIGIFTCCWKGFSCCWIMHVENQNSFSVVSEHVRIGIQKFSRHQMNITTKRFNLFAATRVLNLVPFVFRGLMHQSIVPKIVGRRQLLPLCGRQTWMSRLNSEKHICCCIRSVVSDTIVNIFFFHFSRNPLVAVRLPHRALVDDSKLYSSFIIEPRHGD